MAGDASLASGTDTAPGGATTTRTGWLIAAAIIAILFTLQSARRVGNGPWGVDGSYYLQVARHVAEGHGLQTSVCLYHQGLPELPAPTNIYPLWPLLLGLAGRIVPLTAAATFLPRVLYVLDLLLLYALVTRLFGSRAFARVPAIDYGHVAIALFGMHVSFFSATCYPYTEGLAFFFAFAALLLLTDGVRRSTAWLFAVCGFVAALAFLTRSQMLMLAPGFLLALAAGWWAGHVRAKHLAAWLAGYALPVCVWIAYLARSFDTFAVTSLVSMRSGTTAIPPYDLTVPTSGVAGFIIDRLGGLLVMFNPLSQLSFVSSFGPVAFLVPVAAVHTIATRQIRASGVNRTATHAVLLTGAFASLVLLASHNTFFLEWLFGYRHGLPFVLLIIPAFVYLLERGGRALRALTLLCIAVSLTLSVPKLVSFVTEPLADWPSLAEKQLSSWLESRDPNAVVLTTNAQGMGVASRANFRWSVCTQSPEATRRLLTLIRTDYVMLYEQERTCRFIADLPDLLRPVAQFGSAPNRILLLENSARRSHIRPRS